MGASTHGFLPRRYFLGEFALVLTPGRYVGLPDDEEVFDFEARFTVLKVDFEVQLAEEKRLNKRILESLEKVRYN